MKTTKAVKLEDLERKVWYRAVKVIYVLGYIAAEIYILGFGGVLWFVSVQEGESDMGIVLIVILLAGIVVVPLFFYLVKHIFYYILLGHWNPGKTLETQKP